ncbi:hypothetical protein P152DRAFT_449081 [Eremomyces bilateralis CBS 781.70]|uniref:RRM domain-containing protein n=1 Tax=Eremomyces bilateralis CBS 781.70 TaxID=1392243 RepID=A0A6G1G4X5_9PEZI|nr:uncharacterized protein P152DRAFT_449081 [Eremomyces bilateralis CBS 781.70]KAF1812991.1 hypothetical protein P152DRAFT_449081 [Eremomyces bilateralis CBS 781.70]
MSSTVNVENISHQTTEKEVRDFFSFCGKISSLSVKPVSKDAKSPQSATVTFEKETAAKTALLLDNTQLGPSQVHVASTASIDDLAGDRATSEPLEPTEAGDVAQEDKPRARILAEYLAQGYVLSDKAIEKGIALDKQHGVSERFQKALHDFDTRFHASERAQAADQRLGVSTKGGAAWRGLTSYFEKALETPTGQRLRKFYEDTNKQVMDVHGEAKHLASLKKEESPAGDAEKAGVETVPGTDRTKCNCGANAAGCPCPAGKCSCTNCAKNPEAPSLEKPSAGASTTEKA